MILAAFALALQAPAWAAELPPALPSTMHRTMERYRYFSNCVATRDWAVIGAMFETPIGSAEEGRYLRLASGGRRGTECTYAEYMRMTGMLMRGGIAESRYRHVYAGEVISSANAEIAPAPANAAFEWVGFNRDSAPALLHTFSTCLAERETGAVHAVLMSEHGSRDERRAFQALARRFGTCLGPGQRLRANPLTLRPWLGEAQYQHFRARRPDPA